MGKILVVDDEKKIRNLYRKLLALEKYEVIEAEDSQGAAHLLVDEKDVQLVLLDINMPLMDGLKLLNIVRKDPAYCHIPVIIVTTEGAEADREKGLKLGANAYLSKPIQTNDLLKTIKTLLQIE